MATDHAAAMLRKAPPRGLRWCAEPDCRYLALTDWRHCVQHFSAPALTVIGGPWPERIGADGWDVTAEMDPAIYPRHGLGRGEIIILLRADPVPRGTGVFAARDPRWTCVIQRRDTRA